MNWLGRNGVEDFLIQNAVLGYYPNVHLGVVPVPGDKKYAPLFTYDHSPSAFFEFHSNLINGLGRHRSVPFIQSRLSEFTVNSGETYRFRLIGAQANFLFRFSIDSHKLTVVSTDGYFIEPIDNVDYIIIHSGERYDFLLTANQIISNYIIRLETLDLNTTGTPPFPHLGEGTQAILHYNTAAGDGGIPSSNYEAIYNASPETVCNAITPCRVVNCPFENFHPSYYSNCINVGDFRLLLVL